MESREFFKNMTGDPRTGRYDGGAAIGSTYLPVIKVVKKIITDQTSLTSLGTITIAHGLNRRCDFFGRAKTTGASEWMIIQVFDIASGTDPTNPKVINVSDIRLNDIVLQVNNLTAPLEIELYFIDSEIK